MVCRLWDQMSVYIFTSMLKILLVSDLETAGRVGQTASAEATFYGRSTLKTGAGAWSVCANCDICTEMLVWAPEQMGCHA